MKEKYVNEHIFCVRYTDEQKERYVKRLRQVNAKRIIMFVPRSFHDDEKRHEVIEVLKENAAFFEKNGFEVAVNFLTIGFGETIERMVIDDENVTGSIADEYVRLHDFYGNNTAEAYCPTDKKFVDSICNYLKDIARAGIRIIILEDDLCMNIRPGLGCACENHMAILREKLHEDIQREDLEKKIFCGAPNKYRKAWLEVMGDTLRDFCRTLRASVDEVDPTIRMGQMVSYTNWDLEGADALELCRILAGNTRPIMRISGAPYWVSSFQRFGFLGLGLPAIVEFVRLQETWCESCDVELFDENDNFPRPRVHSPAALHECYDLCLTAAGNVESFLHNCQVEEYPTAEYATGYEEVHVRNMPVTQWMLEHFSGDPVGVRVYEAMHKVEYMTFPEKFAGQQSIMNTAFSSAQAFLANLSIPTQLKGDSTVGLAFGVVPHFMEENERKNNLILDAVAAMELQKAGVDTGIASMKSTVAPNQEYFPEEMRTISLYYFNGQYYETVLKDNAEILSWFCLGNKKIPAAYRYENADGQKFLVYTFDSGSLRQDSDTLVSLNRQRQLLKQLEWLGGNPVATCEGHPGLYMICRKNEESLCVAMCNMAADWVYTPVVQLNEEYKNLEICGYEANIRGKKVEFASDIPPYGFVCFKVNL